MPRAASELRTASQVRITLPRKRIIRKRIKNNKEKNKNIEPTGKPAPKKKMAQANQVNTGHAPAASGSNLEAMADTALAQEEIAETAQQEVIGDEAKLQESDSQPPVAVERSTQMKE